MNEILDTVEQKWISKKELMSICNCSGKTLERAIEDLSSDTGVATQIHIKTGGYHNSETAIKDLNIETGFDIQTHIKTGGYHNLETAIKNLSIETGFDTQIHMKTGGYHNSETFYDEDLVKLIQAKLLGNQINQGNSSDEIKQLVATSVKNELIRKTLTKEEIKIELARNKTLQLQSKAQIESSKAQIESSKTQRQIVTEQERTKREQIRFDKEQTIFKRKEVEVELLKQQNIKKALKIKSFTDPLKQELKSMSNELAQQAVQAEYTKKLKDLDGDGKYMLYIFYNPTNPTIYKIGKSNSLGNRLAIGTSENPNLTILYKKWCNCQIACDELENTIHQELREFNYKNYSDTGSTEWFVLTKEKLNEIVKKYEFKEVE